jgi:hypothetical protein
VDLDAYIYSTLLFLFAQLINDFEGSLRKMRSNCEMCEIEIQQYVSKRGVNVSENGWQNQGLLGTWEL